jgi:KGK domain
MQTIPVTKQYEIVTFDSVVLMTQPQETPYANRNLFSTIELSRPLMNLNQACSIHKFMRQSFDCMMLSPNKNWRKGKVRLSLVLQPQGIALVGDDTVISCTGNSTNNIAKKLTFFSPDHFIKTIEPHVGNDIYPWLRKSFECRVLVPGEDWQHGQIKLSLVFYPDKAIDNETEFTKSSLDEIRKTIVESSE